MPGCVDGWDELRQQVRHAAAGRTARAGIDYAEEGFPVREVIAGDWQGRRAEAGADPELGRRASCPDGQAPARRRRVQEPALAAVATATIAEGGRDAFYKGRSPKQIVAFSRQGRRPVRAEGLRRAHVDLGRAGLDELPRLRRLGAPAATARASPRCRCSTCSKPLRPEEAGAGLGRATGTCSIEAKKLAYADRAKFYADPEFAKVPVAELISKAYADERAQADRPDEGARPTSAPGDPKLGKADTIYLTRRRQGPQLRAR